MSDNFKDACSWLAELSKQYVQNGQLVFPRTEPLRNAHMLALGIYWVPDQPEDRSCISGEFHCSNEAVEKLLNICEQDAAAFDLCKEISAHRLATGGDFLPALKTFTALYMLDLISRPKTKRRSVTWLRNMYLLTMAKVASKAFSLDLTRGDSSPAISACDAVVAGIAANGHHISFRAVKELCVGTGGENVTLRQEFQQWVDLQMVAVERDELARRLFHRTWLGVGVNQIPPS